MVLSASSKDEMNTSLGRSPDHIDAVAMAVWVGETKQSDGHISPTWGATRAEDVMVF